MAVYRHNEINGFTGRRSLIKVQLGSTVKGPNIFQYILLSSGVSFERSMPELSNGAYHFEH
jgi:hypothetical protein